MDSVLKIRMGLTKSGKMGSSPSSVVSEGVVDNGNDDETAQPITIERRDGETVEDDESPEGVSMAGPVGSY